MSDLQEWNALQVCLHSRDFKVDDFKNQFYRRLLIVLTDPNATDADKLLAFRDALRASPSSDGNHEIIRLQSDLTPENTVFSPESWGVRLDYSGGVSLLFESNSEDTYAPVYSLQKRRYIEKVMMDVALKRKLGKEKFENYNGVAQRMSVRLAITDEANSTIAISLPTGCGKTLVAHALSLFSNSSKLVVVVVPTTALAIEQGLRAKELYAHSSEDHGGAYAWHGDIGNDQKEDIKKRIRNRQQRMLFCSPETLQGALLPSLFRAARENALSAIFVDEAHMVDQWGAEFRPEFQIIGTLVQAFRQESKDGFKCILMSATFTDNSLKLVENLFKGESKFYYINGAFLRPEIQFEVKKVHAQEHRECILRAAVELPKPLIIYTLEVKDAENINSDLSSYLSRVALFTGKTPPKEREGIIRRWNNDDIDIVVATSAFGLGMDKGNVRSVLHAAVPETLDRFYQEVGRGGRDGNASQSTLIYHQSQISTASRLAKGQLITTQLGFEKWLAMWNQGEPVGGGRRRINIESIRLDQQVPNEQNTQWNLQTLLLMRRAGVIDLKFESFNMPQQYSDTDVNESSPLEYIGNYYKSIEVEPLINSHRSMETWARYIEPVRQQEKGVSDKNFQMMKRWLADSDRSRLCVLLTDHYSIDGYAPEYACGGCPCCRQNFSGPSTPTLGLSVYTNREPQSQFKKPMINTELGRYIYFDTTQRTYRRQVREWSHWLEILIEKDMVGAIRAERTVLQYLDREIFRTLNGFWISNDITSDQSGADYWTELTIQLNDQHHLYDFSEVTSPKILLAPSTVSDPKSGYRKWWESKPNAISLDVFLSEIG